MTCRILNSDDARTCWRDLLDATNRGEDVIILNLDNHACTCGAVGVIVRVLVDRSIRITVSRDRQSESTDITPARPRAPCRCAHRRSHR
jgi:hypothetical protein